LSELVINVPDIGDVDEVEVIEVSVAVGDRVEENDTLIVLESDKASMEIPSSQAGVVTSLLVSIGQKVSEGVAIVALEIEAAEPEEIIEAEPPVEASSVEQSSEEVSRVEIVSTDSSPQEFRLKTINVPDLGGEGAVEVIEVSVVVGDQVAVDDTLIVLESDKASMEIPSPDSGTVKAVLVTLGDKVDKGIAIIELEVSASASQRESVVETERTVEEKEKPKAPEAKKSSERHNTVATLPVSTTGGEVYAGPAVRLMARELGVDLTQVTASGPKGRILKEDVQNYVKAAFEEGIQGQSTGIPVIPDIDFSRFGDIEEKPLSRIQKLTAAAMQRSWLNVPHVTQFDDADVTDLEEFRAQNKEKATKRNLKLTPLPFLLKACAVALREHPNFNVSLTASRESLIFKNYCHIGVAMNTPAGLMVPVIRDVDKKGIWELAKELTELGVKGQQGKLGKADLEGGCFTISSLGAIGGTGFTPIVNTPEVGILGVSKTQIKPVYIEDEFVPRKMLPLTLSYDHRAVNGVDAGQFMTCLTCLLADIRRLLM
jgi:pyruvate dehydrogenase E2 component (dihydrolipoamide acetyltransferase)